MLEEDYYYKFLAVGRDDKYAVECTTDGEIEYQWGWKWLKEPLFTKNVTKFSDASIENGVVLPVVDENEEPFWCTEIFPAYYGKEIKKMPSLLVEVPKDSNGKSR